MLGYGVDFSKLIYIDYDFGKVNSENLALRSHFFKVFIKIMMIYSFLYVII